MHVKHCGKGANTLTTYLKPKHTLELRTRLTSAAVLIDHFRYRLHRQELSTADTTQTARFVVDQVLPM